MKKSQGRRTRLCQQTWSRRIGPAPASGDVPHRPRPTRFGEAPDVAAPDRWTRSGSERRRTGIRPARVHRPPRSTSGSRCAPANGRPAAHRRCGVLAGVGQPQRRRSGRSSGSTRFAGAGEVTTPEGWPEEAGWSVPTPNARSRHVPSPRRCRSYGRCQSCPRLWPGRSTPQRRTRGQPVVLVHRSGGGRSREVPWSIKTEV